MFCDQCGTPHGSAAKFCQQCGTALASNDDTSPASASKSDGGNPASDQMVAGQATPTIASAMAPPRDLASGTTPTPPPRSRKLSSRSAVVLGLVAIVCAIIIPIVRVSSRSSPVADTSLKPPSSSWGASAAGQATSAASSRRWQGSRHQGLPVPDEAMELSGVPNGFTMKSTRFGAGAVSDWFVATWEADGLMVDQIAGSHSNGFTQFWRDPKTSARYQVEILANTPVWFVIYRLS